MKEQIVVQFYIREERQSRAEAVFRHIGRPDIQPAAKPPLLPMYWYTLVFDSELEFERFHSAAQEQGLEEAFSFRRERRYSDRELRSAPLLSLRVTQAEKGQGGPEYGTSYNLSQACWYCGTGAVQMSPLVLDRAEIRVSRNRSIFQTFDDEFLVALEFGKALEEAGVTGLELRQAVTSTDHSPLPWLQMIAHFTLPPMAASTRGLIRDRQCPYCNRDGYFGTTKEPEEIHYRASEVDMEALPDIVQTWECFGLSVLRVPFEKSHFATPLLLVKPKVFDLFRQHKVREVAFTPVILDTDQ